MSVAAPGARRVHGVEVVPVDLAAVDRLRPRSAVVFLWSDVRPLGGAAGYLDWRLCGALSRALEGGALAGASGETALLPARGRLGDLCLFVFGLGPAADLDPAVVRATLARARAVLGEARVSDAVWLAPAASAQPELEERFLAAVVGEPAGPWWVDGGRS